MLAVAVVVGTQLLALVALAVAEQAALGIRVLVELPELSTQAVEVVVPAVLKLPKVQARAVLV
jgi:hypothetical protein